MRLLVIIYVFFLSYACIAQDILIKRNGDELKVKIIDITPTTVKYQLFENINGPTIEIIKSDIFMIKYLDGKKVMYSKVAAPALNANKPQEYTGFKIEERDGRYYVDGKHLTFENIVGIIKVSGNVAAYKTVRSAKPVKFGKPLIITGAALMGAGAASFVTTFFSVDNQNGAITFIAVVGGIIFSAAGAACLIPGIIFKGVGSKNLEKAVMLYNEGLTPYNNPVK